ncbi:MAG: tetratricopeptide repeat protein, partial [Thermoanaerobaculia bacterium]
QRAIRLDPKSATTLANLGTCHYFLGQYANASDYLEQAAALKPQNYIVWANLGDARRWTPGNETKAGEAFENAVRTGKHALTVNPNDALAHAIVGSSLAKLGRHDEAKREIDAALQIDPTNSDALYHAAVSAHLRGDDPSALGWLNRAVRAGYGATNAERDPEWNAVRSRPEFREALKTS